MAATAWTRPGGGGAPSDSVIVHDSGRGQIRLTKAARMGPGAKARLMGGAGVFRPSSGPGVYMEVTVQGARVAAEHAAAFEEMIGPIIWSIQDITGQWAVQEAQQYITSYDAIDSGDTRKSIHYFMTTTGAGIGSGTVTIDVGPTTYYAPFIEYGMGSHVNYGPRPFMMDTFFRILPLWHTVFKELADLGKRGGRSRSFQTHPYAQTLNSKLGLIRNKLYTVEKEIGDIFPLGLPIGIGRHLRSGMINMARILGDVQAVVGRAVGMRVTRRLSGKVTGRLLGIGAHSVFGSANYSGSISGGTRVYNRVAGKYMARFASQNRLLSGRANNSSN